MKLATRIYRLTPGEMERFDCIYSAGMQGRSFRKSFIAEARQWRGSWRKELKTNKCCRWRYLAEICSISTPPRPETPMRGIPSSARYLCWRVEMEVRRVDAQTKQK